MLKSPFFWFKFFKLISYLKLHFLCKEMSVPAVCRHKKVFHANRKRNTECQVKEALSSLQSAPYGRVDGPKAAESCCDVASELNGLPMMAQEQLH